jgi:hypothetical protein
LERTTGIEPAFSAWEADVLPLYDIRLTRHFDPSARHPACSATEGASRCRATAYRLAHVGPRPDRPGLGAQAGPGLRPEETIHPIRMMRDGVVRGAGRVVSVVGLPNVVAAAPSLAMALGYDVDDAIDDDLALDYSPRRPTAVACRTASLREETPSFR